MSTNKEQSQRPNAQHEVDYALFEQWYKDVICEGGSLRSIPLDCETRATALMSWHAATRYARAGQKAQCAIELRNAIEANEEHGIHRIKYMVDSWMKEAIK